MFDDASIVSMVLNAYARGYARGRVGNRDMPDYVEVLAWIGEYAKAYKEEYGDTAKWGKQFIENIAGALADQTCREQLQQGDLIYKSLISELMEKESQHE